jgi:ubiquinone/menaquinone biosynthesis C-methylase UbiE
MISPASGGPAHPSVAQPRLRCPDCASALLEAPLRCPGCGQAFASTLGIPDLRPRGQRTPHPPAVQLMVERFEHASSDELRELRLSGLTLTAEERSTIDRYGSIAKARTRRMAELFLDRASAVVAPPRAECALDLGCGIGAGLLALAQRFEQVCGVDTLLPSLLVARKLLDEHGIQNVRLFQGDARRLPFDDEAFDYLHCLNVLEHVFDPDQTLAEARRVLGPGGIFCGDSRNRYDVFFPEPHVGLRLVGWLPRRLMPRYVRWRRNASYDYVHLLSLGDLRRAAGRSFGADFEVRLPDIRAYGRAPGALAAALTLLDRSQLGRRALLPIFPTHLLIAWRAAR